jgi:hypothetical protein
MLTFNQAISTIMAISGILPFLMKQTTLLKKVDPQIVGKLLAAKIIVVAEIVISLIFSILTWTDSFEPTSTISSSQLTTLILLMCRCADRVY